MKGLLEKDFLTIQKKYGIGRIIMDIGIIILLCLFLAVREQSMLVFC